MKNYNLFYLLFFLCFTTSAQVYWKKDSLFIKGQKLKLISPDEAMVYYYRSLKLCTENNDTIGIIRNNTEISDIYKSNMDYTMAYDGYWKALLLAKNFPNKIATGRVYRELGGLHGLYKRNKEAIKYLKKSLELSKKLYYEKKINNNYVVSDYAIISKFYSTSGLIEKSKIYLDSAIFLYKKHNPNKTNYHFEIEKAFFLGEEGKLKKAIEKIETSYKFTKKNNQSYLPILGWIAGNIYAKTNNIKKAKFYFEEGINASNKHKSHKEHKLKCLIALSKLHYESNHIHKAYEYLKKAKKIEDKTFNITSFNNQKLFNLNDKYREKIEKQDQLLKKQELDKLVQKEKILNLKLIYISIISILLIVFAFTYIRNLMIRHKKEKEKNKLIRINELQKQKDILELKNKELTSSALRLIEKDQFINKISNKLSTRNERVNVSEIKRMIKSEKKNNTTNWSEFETRFTKVNKKFYVGLNQKHPNLSLSEKKLCAFIKLKLTSKEIASLMGVSNESVHTFRYRLRKKLNLKKEVSLTEYIDNIKIGNKNDTE
ncbi:LuxR C-terminal-related transcriptional regulator [Wenyingzhuangia aestuarii]|uniref:LuxR C-terminal-related transcriptional regulator n=1 Tax=Wenyingzhuangia aestuarii TaxID=1647582 RepID=UPI00143B05A4|nr:LuxR C-terminal-related transcriptional regulator [Wenyingzhuangia aestuarii]NJB82539.1 tetratricopeptide (TPR) repeat protein/DNA-binding CsgD family transcriptional regulator [Wenyingzhuangia aestuarii]